MDNDIEAQIESIRESVRNFRTAQIYITFAELGLGPALQQGSADIQSLATSTNTDQAGLERFIDAAEAFGLVERGPDKRIALTALGEAMYAPSSPNSLNNALQLEGAFYRRWGRLSEAVRTGARPEANRAQEDDPDWVRMFTMALFENSRGAAHATASVLRTVIPRSEPGELRRVVDLGGGHGGYSIALARLRSDLQLAVFDLPPVIEVTEQVVKESGLGERIFTVAGDFHVDEIGSDLDAVMLFGVLHGETPDNAANLLKTIRAALKPGGLLLIRRQGQSKDGESQGDREMFDLHMLLSTEGGRVQRSLDTQELVISSGFIDRGAVDIPASSSGQILVFQRDS